MRPSLTLLAILALMLAACGPSESGATTTTTPAASTTTEPAPATTEAPAVTTTAETPSEEGAQFAITMVTFGDSPMIVITNAGDVAGNLGGHFLCQRPSYWGLPELDLPAGQSVAISVGGSSFDPPADALTVEETAAIGPLDAADGEVGLYRSSNFASPDAIVSYVEWGSAGHGRSSVAVDAGIWSGFVDTTDNTVELTAVAEIPTSADDWAIDR